MYSFNLVLFYIMTFSVVPTLIMMMNAPKAKAPKKNIIGLKDISFKSLLKTKNQYTITPIGIYEIRFKKEKVPKYSIFTDEKGKIKWDFKNEFVNNKFAKNFITSNPDAAIKISVIKPKQGKVKQRSIVLAEYRNYVDMQDEMQKNGGRLYMKDKIEFDELRKNKTKPTENQKSKGRNLNVESDEQPLLGADQLADDEGAYEDEEHKDELKIGKMPSKSRNGESSRSKGRSGTSKQQKMPEYSPESSPIHHPMQRPRGQHDEYGYGAAGPYDQQNLAGYGTPQKQTEMMGANRGFMGGQGATMPAGYRGASPAGQGNYVPVPIPIVVENGGESSNEEQDDRDAEHQNSDSDEAAHNGNDSNSDDENQDNSGETENFGKNPTSPAQSEGEHDGQTPDGEANHSSGETEAKSDESKNYNENSNSSTGQSEEKKSEDESDQGSNEESEAGSGQTKKSDEIPNFLGEYESN